MLSKKRSSFGIAALALATVLATTARAEEVFKLGFVGGFTGYLAPYDQPSLDGLQFGVDEANKLGGLTGKLKIELISRDTRSETAESAVIAEELVGQGINFLIVPCDVDPAVAAGQIAVAAGIPAMSSCASTPTLPGIVGDYMFSNYTADNLQAAALVEHGGMHAGFGQRTRAAQPGHAGADHGVMERRIHVGIQQGRANGAARAGNEEKYTLFVLDKTELSY